MKAILFADLLAYLSEDSISASLLFLHVYRINFAPLASRNCLRSPDVFLYQATATVRLAVCDRLFLLQNPLDKCLRPEGYDDQRAPVPISFPHSSLKPSNLFDPYNIHTIIYLYNLLSFFHSITFVRKSCNLPKCQQVGRYVVTFQEEYDFSFYTILSFGYIHQRNNH